MIHWHHWADRSHILSFWAHPRQPAGTARCSDKFRVADPTLGIDPGQANQPHVAWKRFSRCVPGRCESEI